MDYSEYSTEDVIKNFIFVFEHINFKETLAPLNIKFIYIRKRKRALQQLHALTIGLWKLALQRSFPLNHEEIFEKYLQQRNKQCTSKRKKEQALQFQTLVYSYLKILEKNGDRDFTDVSEYFIKSINSKIPITHADVVRLKITLNIRSIYEYIFKRLI